MTRSTCDQVRPLIGPLHEGWLDGGDADRVREHLAACPECAAEARRDARLAAMFDAVPAETPPSLQWEEAPHARRRPAHTARPLPVFGLAAAALALLGVFLALREGPRIAPPAVPMPPTRTLVATGYVVEAHAMLAAADDTGDPNRAVVLMYAARRGAEATR